MKKYLFLLLLLLIFPVKVFAGVDEGGMSTWSIINPTMSVNNNVITQSNTLTFTNSSTLQFKLFGSLFMAPSADVTYYYPTTLWERNTFCVSGTLGNGASGINSTSTMFYYTSIGCYLPNGSLGHIVFNVNRFNLTAGSSGSTMNIYHEFTTTSSNTVYISWYGNEYSTTQFPVYEPTDTVIKQNDNILSSLNTIYLNNQQIYYRLNETNSLLQQFIESQIVCTTIESTKDNYSVDNSEFNSSGSIISNNNWVISNWYEINNDSTIKVIQDFTTSNRYLVFYKEDKSLLSVINLKDFSQGSYISVPANAYYLRFSIFKQSNKPQLEIKTCKNGNQAIADQQEQNNQIQQERNDFLNDDDTSESSSTGSDFFNSFNTSSHGLTGIITAPLNLITSITSKTCSPLVLPLPFVNQNIELPCMSSIYSQYFGSFYDIYKVITFGIVAYWVCVRIFNLVKDFKNPEHDEIEVVDL